MGGGLGGTAFSASNTCSLSTMDSGGGDDDSDDDVDDDDVASAAANNNCGL